MRKLELTWKELEVLILVKKEENPLIIEEIKEITLMKPKRIRIYLGRK